MALSHVQAPAHWQRIDFVSDLHLQQADATWACFAQYLRTTPADAVFLLGDMVELWAGDDALHHPEHVFERELVALLHATSQHKSLYFMHGNRDFLVGEVFCQAAGMALLADPCVLEIPAQDQWAGQRILLSHGDALCTDDAAYMQFRAQVRNPAWQQGFLSQPLQQRLHIARQLRQQSSQRKNAFGMEGYADVNATLAAQWLQSHTCHRLVHGHTHQPAEHLLPSAAGVPLQRSVLSDWDMLAQPPRAEVMCLTRNAHSAAAWSRQALAHACA